MSPIVLDGWITTVTSWLSDTLGSAFRALINPIISVCDIVIDWAINAIYDIFGSTLRNIMYILFRLVDFFESIFNIFAGTDKVRYDGEEMYLLDVFVTHDSISTALMYVIFIGIALCFIFTIYSVTKSMGSYALENRHPIGEVMKNALKACISFAIIPIMMFFGLQLSSALLVSTERAVMGAYGTDSIPSTSTVIFLSGSFGDTNISGDSFTEGIRVKYYRGELDPYGEQYSVYNDEQICRDFNMKPSVSLTYSGMPQLTDEELSQIQPTNGEQQLGEWNSTLKDKVDNSAAGKMITNASFNFVFVYLACIIIIIIMICAIFVFIRRIIEVAILYVTAPLFVSAMPLDGGAVFGKWRQMFIGKLFTGFGIVISMKLVFMLTPIIFTPNLRLYGASTTIDNILKTLFMVASFYAAWKSSTLITELISPEAAMAERDSMEVIGHMARQAAMAGIVAATGGAGAAGAGAGNAGTEAAANSSAKSSSAFRGGGNTGGFNAGNMLNKAMDNMPDAPETDDGQ